MDQDIIVMLIVASTVGYIALSFVKSIRPKKIKSGGCGGCTGCELSKFDRGCH